MEKPALYGYYLTAVKKESKPFRYNPNRSIWFNLGRNNGVDCVLEHSYLQRLGRRITVKHCLKYYYQASMIELAG